MVIDHVQTATNYILRHYTKVQQSMETGERVYIGAVIDYHY